VVALEEIMKCLLALTLILATVGLGLAQESTGHTGHPLINGSQTPQLIPDAVAYRMVFITFSTPSPNQRNLISGIALNKQDSELFTKILANFYNTYQALSDQYNRDAESGQGNLDTFLINRNQLVRSTRQTVNATLSPAGAKLLDAFVKVEKLGMNTNEDQ
jgi:hypothetical protein